MEVDAPDQRSVRLDQRPASAGCFVTIIHADPTELDRRTALALEEAAINVALDRDESEAA
jgi:hypothetical protein